MQLLEVLGIVRGGVCNVWWCAAIAVGGEDEIEHEEPPHNNVTEHIFSNDDVDDAWDL